MSKDSEYQSDLPRRYFAHQREEGRAEGRQEGLRLGIVEFLSARFPGLRDDLGRWLHDHLAERLVQLAAELGHAKDEAAVRAIFGQRS